jgi:putative transposase
MAYNPDIHNRQSIRLKGYDYSTTGLYYITLCTQDRENRFGGIVDDKIVLNEAGELVDAEWKRIPGRYGQVILDTYQIMPNHLHGILQIIGQNSVGTGLVPVRNFLDESVDDGCIDKNNPNENLLDNDDLSSNRMGTRPISTALYEVIGTFKSLTQNDYAFHVRNNGWPPFRKRLWQLRFHDHIIRDKNELDRIRTYIIDNPLNACNDQNNPENMMKNKDSNA